MGTAVLNATIENTGAESPKTIRVSVHSEASKDRLIKAYGSKITVFQGTTDNNNDIVENSDIIILGCKPFVAESLLSPLNKKLFAGKTVVSLMAGITTETIFNLTQAPVVARAMTNTPSKLGAGMTVVSVVSKEADVPKITSDRIAWLFKNTGKCLFMDEKYQDVSTALCGSGPAFAYVFMEALIDGAVQKGMPYAYAQECAAQVLIGAGKMVQETGLHPAQLKSQVCTPGGTTIGGLMVMEDKGVRSGVARAVEEAASVATRLGKK